MAKFNAKTFLLQKGEKIVLGAALAGLGLLGVMGVSRLVSAESPVKKAQEFKGMTDTINSRRNRTEGDAGVPPLNASLMTESSFRTIDPGYFRSSALPFETVDQPSSKRDNPAVLGITEAQVDLVRAPVKAYEVIEQDGDIKVGLLYNVKIGKLDDKALKELQDSLSPRLKRPRPPAPMNPNAPMAPNAQAPAPMQPGGVRGGGRPGGDAPPGVNAPAGERSEKTVKYVSLAQFDEESKKPGVLPALSVYPIRMIIVHASFPLKEQLEVIRRALRLRDTASVTTETAPPGGGAGPTFLGFEVERRIVSPTGEVYDWLPYDHVGQYLSKINIRKFADQPDDGLLSYFLRYDQMMAMPLPALAANLGIYPGVRLESIVKGYRKMQELNKKPETPSELEKKFKNAAGGNPFAPSGGSGAAAGIGSFGTDAAAPSIDRGDPGRQPRGGERPIAVPQPGNQLPAGTMPELEHMLIRFLDVDIRPGFTYQYRVRVKMKNPNFKHEREVARPDDAKQEVLTGPWVTIANQVNVPVDNNLYAGDPVQYAERLRKEFKDLKVVELLDNKNGELPVMQFQTWTERVPIDSGKSEPAGYWVVAEVPVGRVEYVGRKQLVPLPMWSSEKVQYILQELAKFRVKGAKDQPKGLMVDFTTPTLMVDFEGGKTRTKVGEREITDESDVEVLMLKADGTAVVRSSAVDRENPDRKLREETWRKWLDDIRKATEAAGTLTDPNATNNPFAPKN